MESEPNGGSTPTQSAAAGALRACEGMDADVLARLPPGALTKAYEVCMVLTEHPDIAYGMDHDEEVNGGDLVDLVSSCWGDIRLASGTEPLPAVGDGDADEEHSDV